jgi:hypothetical protein
MTQAPTPIAHSASDALGGVWKFDLTEARDRLITARAHQRAKDSISNRAHVAECRAQIDALLDLYLELWRPRRSTTASSGQASAAA